MRIDLTHWMALHVREKHTPKTSSFRAKTLDYRLFIEFLAEERGVQMATPGHLTTAVVREFIEYHLDLDYAPASVNRQLASLFSLSSWLRERAPELKLPKLDSGLALTLANSPPRSLSANEIRRLQEITTLIEEPFQRERVAFCFDFLLYTGLRRFELMNLPYGALHGDWIVGVCGKGKQVRDVWIDDDLKEALQVWLFVRSRALRSRGLDPKAKHLPLIVSFRGTGRTSENLKMSVEWLGYWFRKLAAESGVTDFTAHTLRHTRAQVLMDRTKDPFMVANQLGHKDLKTTLRYQERSRDELAQKLRA